MKILSHLGAHSRRQIILLSAIGISQMLSVILVMNGIRNLFNTLISPTGSSAGISGEGATLLMMAGGFMLMALLRAQERVFAERLGQGYVGELRVKLFEHLCKLPNQAREGISNGSLLMRFTGDLNALRTWIAQGVARLLVTATFTASMLLWLAFINATITLAIALIISLGFFISWKLGNRLRQRVRIARAKRAALTSNIAEKSDALRVVQVFAQQRREQKRLQRQSDDLIDAMINRAKVIGQLRAVSELTIGAILLSLLFVGVYEIQMGRLEAGTLASMLGMLILLSPSLRNLGRINEYWHAAQVSLDKIERFLAKENQPEGARRISGPLRRRGAVIKLRDVAYKPRLNSLNATIEAGNKLALVGPNGAGKSTLLHLLVRLIDPTNGTISIAGRRIDQLEIKRLRRQISMVSPDLPLLRGTVLRNLRYRNGQAGEDELQRVIQLCQLQPLLNSLPNGLDSRLSERGANLSPGERQRLSLARALLDNPTILLLDEPELNVDPTTRVLIRNIIDDFQGTLVFITHDQEIATLADQIWYMEAGSLAERGRPDELLSEKSRTAQFFQGRASA